MPRLPDKKALGSRPDPKLERAFVRAPDLKGPNRALGNLGKELSAAGNKLSVELKAKREKEQHETDALELAAADAHWTKHALETERNFQQDPDYETYDQRWQLTAANIRDDASAKISNPALRGKWLQKQSVDTERFRSRIGSRALRLKKQANVANLEDTLSTYQSAYSNPNATDEQRERTLVDIDAAIEINSKTGLLEPREAAALREKYIEGAVVNDADQRMFSDPDGLYKDLTQGGSGVSQSGIDFIKRQEGYTAKPKWDVRQYSSGWGTRAESGEKLTKAEHEKRLRDELANVTGWMEENITVPLTQNQTDALASFGFNLGTDDLARLKNDINAGKFDKVAKRMLSFDQVDGKVSAGVKRRREEEAKLFLNPKDAPGGAAVGRYASLHPEKRRAILNRLRVSQRALIQDDIDSDIEQIRRTGATPDGTASLDRGRLFLTPNQYQKKRLAWQEAQAEYQAIAPLDRMSEEEALDHIETLEPKQKSSKLSYKAQSDVQRAAMDYWKDLHKLRERDPAASVEKQPEVNAVLETIETMRQGAESGVEGAQELDPGRAQRMLIEARLEAQRRLGIPEYNIRPITRREAKSLLSMPDPDLLDPREYRKALEEASDRAEEIYGKAYAPMVMKAAIRFQRGRSQDQKDVAGSVLRKRSEAFDENASDETLQHIQGVFGEPEVEVQAHPAKQVNPQQKTLFENAVKNDQTRAALVALAKRSPAKAQKLIDDRFYPGAYADLMSFDVQETDPKIKKQKK